MKKETNNPVNTSSSPQYSIYEEQYKKITQLPQTQISLTKQCEILRVFANKLGLYDAADLLKTCSCDNQIIVCPGCNGEQSKHGICAGCNGEGKVTCGKCNFES